MAYDLHDRKFGRLTVLRQAGRGERKSMQLCWECRCDCGNVVTVVSQQLRSGKTQSCGCYHRERAKEANRTHGKSRSKVYNTWQQMVNRCTNPNYPGFEYYGGKGIRVVERWLTFENFLADMGEPGPQMTIERKNNDEDYSPDNCVWIPRSEQPKNRSTTVWVDYEGQRKTLAEWADQLGICRTTLYQRIVVRKWPVERAMSEPLVRKRGKGSGRVPDKKTAARRIMSVAVRSGELAKPDRCSHPGCERTDVQGHHHNGYDGGHELDVVWLCPAHHPKPNEIAVEWEGRKWTIRELAQAKGLPTRLLRTRLWANRWVVTEKAFSPQRERPGRLITHNGKTRNVKEWAAHLGISIQTVIARLNRGLPLEQVLYAGRLYSRRATVTSPV